ncbi:RNA polymerase sigma factor [Nitrospirillum sp. BR 11752]|uniref:RNA polymerase sigma factor n=1 Tax=Nitrospirillum sp. BR 11752 TaxID=3104293 RepID=UPI002EBEA48D|nr:RNA polymerase sigma factor [Nitrospirillum sp. BR 11752]
MQERHDAIARPQDGPSPAPLDDAPLDDAPFGEERARWLATHILPHEHGLRAWLRSKAFLGFDVDDVVQETYAILVAKACVAGIENPRAYAFQTAYSVVVRLLRQARVVPIAAVADLSALEAVVDAPSPEEVTSARQELRLIQDAIADLPRQTRRAFVMRRVEGLPQQEIARRMRLSENTVEKHIARGLRLLAERFGRGGSGIG